MRPPSSGNPGIRLIDQKGTVRENLSLVPESEPVVELYDTAGKTRVTLGSTGVKNEKTGVLEKRPISSLTLSDENGKVVFSAPGK